LQTKDRVLLLLLFKHTTDSVGGTAWDEK